jgi:hypothetical protein
VPLRLILVGCHPDLMQFGFGRGLQALSPSSPNSPWGGRFGLDLAV